MDSDAEQLTHGNGLEGAASSAPATPCAAVQQVPVGVAKLLTLPVERVRARASSPLRDAAIKALTDSVRNIAAEKNVALDPPLHLWLATIAVDTLPPELLPGLMRAEFEPARRAAAIINRLVDLVAASRVVTMLWQLEGFESIELGWAFAQAEAWMNNSFVPNHSDDNAYRWADPSTMVLAHYKMRSHEPVSIRLPNGQVPRASYHLDRAALRDACGKPAPKGLMPVMLRCPGLPSNPRAPRPDGRCTKTNPDGTTETSYWLGGKLHRPSHEGPAFEAAAKDGASIFLLYAEHGQLHRNAADGPARIHRSGDQLTVEYFWRDVPHRDPMDGPAVIQTDHAGQRILEVYAEHGQPHRDPASGPARVARDGAGRVTLQEFWQHGVLLEGSAIMPPPNRRARRAAKKRKGKDRAGAGTRETAHV